MKRLIRIIPICAFLIASLITVSCNHAPKASFGGEGKKEAVDCLPGNSKLDTVKIEAVTGMKGVEKNGEYKLTVPQNDLHIVVDGFKIIPPMGLGTWVAFTPCGDSVMMMGDIILSENEGGAGCNRK